MPEISLNYESKFHNISLSCNLSSKAELPQFGAAGTERLRTCLKDSAGKKSSELAQPVTPCPKASGIFLYISTISAALIVFIFFLNSSIFAVPVNFIARSREAF